jgi:glycine/D-amino acid oxidase-like deaminating enzyme
MIQTFNQRACWVDSVARSKPEREVEVPERSDVAVLGAGFTGLAAALTLARRGASVVVFERHRAGWGASSRNGGMVLSGLKIPVRKLTSRYGRETAGRFYGSSLAAIDLVERLVADEEIACDFRRCGHLEVACKPSHFEGFKRAAETLTRDFDIQVVAVERADLASELASSAYFGGLLDARSAGLNPAAYAAGLAEAARRAGAIVCEQAGVESIALSPGADGRRFSLVTSRGATRAAEVLIATGAYGGSTDLAVRRRIIPIGSYVIATERLAPATIQSLIPRGRMIFDSRHYLHYFRATPDSRMLFGGRAAFFPETATTVEQSAAILRRDMIAIFPQLADAAVEYAWGGTLDFTYDMLPHAGTIDGMHFAVGYAGHGVAMATYLGAQIARSIAGDVVDEPLLRIPLPDAPLRARFAVPWLLPVAGAWFRLLDWAS